MKSAFVRTWVTVALAGVAGYVYYLESRRPASDDAAKEQVFADLEQDDITALMLTPRGGETIRVEREAEGWKMTEPLEVAADGSAVESLLGSLDSLSVEALIADGETDLAQFGLAEPRVTVEALRKGATEPLRLMIGDTAPAGGGVYARVPSQGRVFTLASYLETTFDKKPFDLRDRELLKLDREQIVGLDVSGASEAFSLERVGAENWRFTSPVRTRGGRWSVDGLVGSLAGLRMESIATEQAEKLADFGLDAPRWSVVVKLQDGSQRRVAIGSSPEEGKHHVRIDDEPQVSVISSLVNDLEKGMDGLRSKRLLDAATYQVTALDVTLDGATHRFEREPKQEGDDSFAQPPWKKTAPDAKDVETNAVQDVLYKVGGIDAQAFVDAPEAPAAYGFEPPALRLVLQQEDDRPEEWVEFGRHAEAVWARRSDDAAVMMLESKALDELLEELKKLL